MMSVKGLDFENCYRQSVVFQIEEELTVRTIHLNNFIEAKKSTGRYKELDDINNLV